MPKPYKPKKAEKIPTKFYDDNGKPIGSKAAIKKIKEGGKVGTKPKAKRH